MPAQKSDSRWWLARFLSELWWCLKQPHLWRVAAAIGFCALLAPIPLLLISSAVLGSVAGSSSATAQAITGGIRRILPGVTGEQIEATLQTLIVGRRLAGGLGLISLIWVASAAFDMVASSLTVLCDLQESRGYLRRKVMAFFLSLISGLAFLLSLAVASLATVIEALGNRLLEFVPATVSLPPGILLDLVPATLVGFPFLLMYRFAPARPLPLGASLAGAVGAGRLWAGAAG